MTKEDRPAPANKRVSEQMRRMPTKNSNPELRLRKALYERGYGIDYIRKVFGKPDITFWPSKLAVFVDGCYWHNCPDHGTIPKIIENGGLKNLTKIGIGTFVKIKSLGKLGGFRFMFGNTKIQQKAAEKIHRLINQRTGA